LQRGGDFDVEYIVNQSGDVHVAGWVADDGRSGGSAVSVFAHRDGDGIYAANIVRRDSGAFKDGVGGGHGICRSDGFRD
jgi:hypothetical protein